MVRPVREGAPRIILHPARALARDPIGVCAAEPGVLDRLMGIDRDVMPRGNFDNFQPQLDLPLHTRGTAFQLEVWKYLQTIPYGEVRSYTEVAAANGKPKRSEERRVGKEGVSTWRSRWSPDN